MRMNENIGVALLGQGAERLTAPTERACAFTRANAPMFFAVAGSLMLTARWYSLRERAAYGFRDDAGMRVWLLQECAPRRLARVQRLREYTTLTWPELDWNAADERFNKLVDSNAPPLEPTLAQRALAQCTAASQAAVLYRWLAHAAEDARLRAIAERSAAEEGDTFGHFRALYEETRAGRRLGFRPAWRTVRRAMGAARDVHVQCAFDALVAQWGPNAPFPAMTYGELTQRVAVTITAQCALSWLERLIFRPWKEIPRPLAFHVREPKQPGFRPVVMSPCDPWSGVRESARWRP